MFHHDNIRRSNTTPSLKHFTLNFPDLEYAKDHKISYESSMSLYNNFLGRTILLLKVRRRVSKYFFCLCMLFFGLWYMQPSRNQQLNEQELHLKGKLKYKPLQSSVIYL